MLYAVFVSTGSDMGRLRALGKPAGVYFEHDLLKDWVLQLATSIAAWAQRDCVRILH
jgi:hypothetical protein